MGGEDLAAAARVLLETAAKEDSGSRDATADTIGTAGDKDVDATVGDGELEKSAGSAPGGFTGEIIGRLGE